jgi:phenylacetate-CoA ligase
MTVRVERRETADYSKDEETISRLEDNIKRHLLVRGKGELVHYGTLPRTERKSKRVFDKR